MAEAKAAVANRPVWVDLSSSDPAGSRTFYSKLFGWTVDVNPDPQYGGYGLARLDGHDVAGIGPKQAAEAPTAWMVYIGTHDADELAEKVTSAGGSVMAPPFAVGDQGRMAVFVDPAGAVISAWEPKAMSGFHAGDPNTFAWAELNSRGLVKAIPFYMQVFGWTTKANEVPAGAPPYTEFQLDGQSVAGAMDMNPMVPAEVPSYWAIYFAVEDVDAAFTKALELKARELVSPQDFGGGRFAILQDPQGAAFGVLKMEM